MREKEKEDLSLSPPLCYIHYIYLNDGGSILSIALHHFLCDAQVCESLDIYQYLILQKGHVAFGNLLSDLILSRSPFTSLRDCRDSFNLYRGPPYPEAKYTKYHLFEKKLQPVDPSKWKRWMERPSSTSCLEFGADEISSIKRKCVSRMQSHPDNVRSAIGGYLTSNDVIVSIIWFCIQLSRKKCGTNTRFAFFSLLCVSLIILRSPYLYQAANIRSKTVPPISTSYFGNALTASRHTLPMYFLNQDAVIDPCLAISNLAAILHDDIRYQVIFRINFLEY